MHGVSAWIWRLVIVALVVHPGTMAPLGPGNVPAMSVHPTIRRRHPVEHGSSTHNHELHHGELDHNRTPTTQREFTLGRVARELLSLKPGGSNGFNGAVYRVKGTSFQV
jgi:hypothetical protein